MDVLKDWEAVAHARGLLAECNSSIARAAENGLDPFIVLVLHGRRIRGLKARLFPRRGPLGEVLCETPRGDTVARFDARKVKSLLEAELAARVCR